MKKYKINMKIEARPGAHIVIINFYKWDILQKSTKINRLLQNIPYQEIEKIFKEFTVYILSLYKSLILHAIQHQKFPKKYVPLSPSWVKYKKDNRLSSGFWQAYGFSQIHLEFWRLKDGHYAIGFKRNLTHPVSGEKVWKIHNWVEHGTKKMPPRELYGPIAKSIRKHIYDVHFKRFIVDKYPKLFKFLD
jgi:hypothetical protein